MFDVPADAAYVWLGVATVGTVALAVALGLPSASPPEAGAVADAVDAVAAGPPGSRGSHGLAADRIRIGPHRLGLEGPGGRAHATFAYGPITPVGDGPLGRVLGGHRRGEVFDSQEAFERAVRDARTENASWRPAPDNLRIRRVRWGDVDATLVG